MSGDKRVELENFRFRHLHPNVNLGTASDRYAGWIGQIYSKERYKGRITKRQRNLGGRAFVEEVLPVESVEEYFEHFRVLELDFTFYRTLFDKEGKPTQNHHVLRTYKQHLKTEDLIILKVPQVVFAGKLKRGGGFVENSQYLDPEVFMRRFYEPAIEMLDPWLEGLIFEQEYQRKAERPSPGELAAQMDEFFGSIQKDGRYHVELRTEALLTLPVLDVLEKHGVGLVLSHWTWLPPLSKQFVRSGKRFLSSRNHGVVRLMTPRGVKYEDAYARAHPFNALVEGMLDQDMVIDAVNVMQAAVKKETPVNVIINNRAGGNAPLVAQHLARHFLSALYRD